MLLTLATAAGLMLDPVVEGLRDPMELDLAPDGSLYIVEREGRVLRADTATGGLFEIGRLEVTALRETNPESNFAREDGLLGIALDPGFAENQRLYLYYSHPEESLNRLSRFTLSGGLLDAASEKVLLDIPTQREKRVCHHGGSLEFGPDGLLHLSTGDNTTPFESNGYTPIDDREDRGHADAMRTAGNSNDLRGKILRIRPTEDGYAIPEGNLFPPGTPDTRPEIYVMGCRNPFRISIDPRSGILYWGEVGPDAREATRRGPIGHDEVNQARAAGNFGWPFVIADNRPYALWDFGKNEPIAETDPAAPRNPGRRNTGIAVLPPANPALIYYPYSRSETFPQLGDGGRNAMAGPVFYYDARRKWNVLPESRDHSLLVYDWMRGGIWAAGLDENENFAGLEQIARDLQHPMDLLEAPDGSLYLLEYGSRWYFNRDGRVRRILPAGTPPLPPLAIERTPEGGARVAGTTAPVEWWITIGTGEQMLAEATSIESVPAQAEELRAVLPLPEGRRAIARLDFRKDELPAIALELPDAPESLAPGDPLRFAIDEKVPEPVIRIRHIATRGHDAAAPSLPAPIHELLTEKQCFACHQIDTPSVGPRYTDVALRYRGDAEAPARLLRSLREGSAGTWGEVPMPPQVALEEADAQRLIEAVLGLGTGMAELRGEHRGSLRVPDFAAAKEGAWEITVEAPGHQTARIRLPAR